MGMEELEAEVYAALAADGELAAELADGARSIYHLSAPARGPGKYPILVYSPVSDIPALHADNGELLRQVTMRFHAVTRDGAYGRIALRIGAALRPLGYMRVREYPYEEDGLRILVADYRKGVES